jgi:hypothetical protein
MSTANWRAASIYSALKALSSNSHELSPALGYFVSMRRKGSSPAKSRSRSPVVGEWPLFAHMRRLVSTYSGHTRTAPCDLSTYPTRFDWKSRRHSERWGGCGGHGSAGGALARVRGGGARGRSRLRALTCGPLEPVSSPRQPRTAKKIWFSLSTILGKSGVAEKTRKLKSGFFCVGILMILWSRACRRE